MDPQKIEYFKMDDFLESIDDHFDKSIDYLLLDLRAFDKTQKTQILDHIAKTNPEKAKTMLMTLD